MYIVWTASIPFVPRILHSSSVSESTRTISVARESALSGVARKPAPISSNTRRIGGTSDATIGKPAGLGFLPHVSVGYFADLGDGKRLADDTELIQQLTAAMCRALDTETITVDRWAIYGFTSMVKFFTLKEVGEVGAYDQPF